MGAFRSGLVASLLMAAACLATVPLSSGPAVADGRDSFLDERPGIGEPLRFRAANGGAFRPRALIVTGAGGAVAAALPGTARETRSEDRVDLSGAPLVGHLFPRTLDVASVRQGPLVGPVYRVGDALVVDATVATAGLVGRPVALSTNLPRLGAVSYRLAPLDWAAASPPAGARTPLGTAHIVGGALVLASAGGEPAWPSVDALLRDLF